MADVSFPLKVVYCGTCGFPPDLCAFSGRACAAAAKAAEKAAAEGAAAASTGDAAVAAVTDGVAAASISGAAGDAPAAAAGAGAAAPPAADSKSKKKGKKEKPANAVVISSEKKGRRDITIINGLEHFDIKLKDAASALGKKFGSGGTVTKNASGVQEVHIQGDFSAELEEMLPEMYPQIPEEAIVVKD